LQTLQDGPVIFGRLWGEFADRLNHLKILPAAGALRNQVPLQIAVVPGSLDRTKVKDAVFYYTKVDIFSHFCLTNPDLGSSSPFTLEQKKRQLITKMAAASLPRGSNQLLILTEKSLTKSF
jgi:hypothetical protein